MRRFYVPQLDGLRFCAILLVIAHHGPRPGDHFPARSLARRVFDWLSDWGWCGVDLFLVLSAFLITTLLLLEHEKHGRISLRNFYIRRILRIWPLYYLAVALGFLVLPALGLLSPPWQSPAHRETVSDHLLAYLTLFGNYSCGAHGYPALKTLVHLWTVTLEEQFYIVWPVLLGLALRVRRQTVAWAMLPAFLALSLCLRFYFLDHTRHPFIYTNTLTRLDPLVVGIGLAFWRFRHPPKDGWRLPAIELVLGSGLILAASRAPDVDVQSVHVVWQLLATAVGFGLILDSTLPAVRNPASWVLSSRPLVWLGKLTYGLYVYHMHGLLAARAIAGRLQDARLVEAPALLFAVTHAIALALTVTAAWLSYRFFESYFLRMKDRFSVIASQAAIRRAA